MVGHEFLHILSQSVSGPSTNVRARYLFSASMVKAERNLRAGPEQVD